jgi:hypothetical protein
VARYFKNSLAELGARNQNIEGRFRQLDSSRFTAVIYVSGATQAQCTISLGGPLGRGISYLNSMGGTGNSFNEMLTVEHDEQHLYLKPIGMWMTGGERDAQLGGRRRILLVDADRTTTALSVVAGMHPLIASSLRRMCCLSFCDGHGARSRCRAYAQLGTYP